MTSHFGHTPWDCACADFDGRPGRSRVQRQRDLAAAVERAEQRAEATTMRENREQGHHSLYPVLKFILPDEVHCVCGGVVAGVPARPREVIAGGLIHLVAPDLSGLRCPYDDQAVAS